MTRRARLTTTSIAIVLAMLLAGCGSDGGSVSTSSDTAATDQAIRHTSPDTSADVLCPFLRSVVAIPKGTTAAFAIAEGMVAESTAPVGVLPSTVIRSLDQLDGAAVFDIGPDTVLVDGMFGSPDPTREPDSSPRPASAPMPPECDPAGTAPHPGTTAPQAATRWTVPPDDADAQAAAPLTTAPDGAQDLGERLVAEVPRGVCFPAAEVELGPLDAVEDWDEVCGWGRPDGTQRGVRISTSGGVPNLAFGAGGPPMPSICVRRVVGDWWSYYSGNGLAEPCSPSFDFHGA